MANKNNTKEALLKLRVDEGQARKALEEANKKLRDMKWAQKEAAAAGDANKLAMVKQARAVDEAKRALKATTDQTKKFNKALKGGSKESKNFSKGQNGISTSSIAFGSALGNIATAALSKFTNALGGMISVARDTEDWIGKDTSAIDGMRKATGGLINDLQLMKTRTQLTNGDLQLTEKQLQAVAKAAIHFTRVNKTSFVQSMDQITAAIQGGSSKALKKLGFNIDLVGDAAEKSYKAVDLITERFGDMNVEAVNTNERIDQLNSTFSNLTGTIGNAILSNGRWVRTMKTLNEAADGFAFWLAGDKGKKRQLQIRDRLQVIGKEIDRLSQAGVKFKQQGGMGNFGFQQINPNDEKKIIKSLEAEREKLMEESHRITMKRDKNRRDEAARIKEADEKARQAREDAIKRAREAKDAEKNRKATIKARRDRAKLMKQADDHMYMLFIKDEERKAKAIKKYEREKLELYRDGRKALEESQKAFNQIVLEANAEMLAKRKEQIQNYTSITTDLLLNSVLEAQSMNDFLGKVASGGLSQISRMSATKAAFHLAEGLGALGFTWGVPNPSATNHFLAAAGFGALALGSGFAGKAAGGATGGSSSRASVGVPGGNRNVSTGLSGSGSGRSSSSGGGGSRDTQTTNIYIQNTKPLLTKKDIKIAMNKLNNGRMS